MPKLQAARSWQGILVALRSVQRYIFLQILSAPIAKYEKHRLKVLWEYSVLDTVPEEIFDDLTELAARICEAPIALITLVDKTRQWFKSKVGIDIKETSRDISFCAHAIKQPELFIIPDATKDARFAHNPLVTSEPKVRFYAGAPLVSPDGYALGTLCVIDKVPRQLRPHQEQSLRILARHVMSQLELRRRALELAEVNRSRERIQQDLKEARSELADALAELRRRDDKEKAAKRGVPSRRARK